MTDLNNLSNFLTLPMHIQNPVAIQQKNTDGFGI